MNNEHNSTDEAFSKNRDWHHTILRAAMDGFWMVDLEGRLLEVNDAYCRMSGYSEQELLAMSVSDLEVNETRELVAGHIARIVGLGEDRFETRHRRKDGNIIDIETSAQYRTFGGGRIIAFLRDVTERRRANEALCESQSFIKAVLDNLPIGIAVNSVDPDTTFMYVNDNLPKFYRTTREELTSPDAFWSAVYEDPDFREEMRVRVMADCAGGDPEKMHWVDVPITRRGDTTTYVEARNTLIHDKRLMVSTVWDVTERKRSELALQQEQNLYEDLVNTLPAGAYRLRVKLQGNWRAATWQTMAAEQYSLDFASDRFCVILGISYNELKANPGVISDVIHPDDKEGFDARNAQAMTDLNTFIWDGRIINNKQIRWVHFESLPRVIDPETVLWTGIVYDITELKQAEKGREQFFKFFQTSADLMCIADPNGAFLKTNPAFTETLGYSEAELVSKPFIEFIHPDDRQATLDEMAQQLRSGFTLKFGNRYICKDGSVKWLSWRANYNKAEGITYATARDVSESKRTEAALRESENRMTLAMQAGNMGLYDLNVATGEAVVNPEYALMLGYDPAEFRETNARWIERLHPDDLEPVAAVYHAYVSGKIPQYKVEFRQKTRDGSWKWILSYGRIMERDADGKPLRMLGVHVDISDRKQAEQSLLETEQKLRLVVEYSTNLFYMHTTGNLLTYVSPQSRRFFDCAPEEAMVHWTELITDNPLNKAGIEATQQAIDTGERQPSYQMECIGRKGRKIWVEVNEAPIVDNGRTVAIAGSLTDISERKQAEVELRASLNLLQTVLENVPIRVFWKDKESRYLGCNSAFARDAGFSDQKELLGKDDFQMGWREQAERYRADDKLVLDSGRPLIGIEEPQTTPGGQTIYLRSSKVPLRNADNKVDGLLGIYEDITEQKLTGDALRESENRLRFALDGTNDGVWDVQMKNGITYLSPRGCEILGYRPDEAGDVASVLANLVHPDDLPLTNERLRAHIDGQTPIFEVEQRLRMKSGDWKWVLARGKIVSRDKDGVPLRMTGTHTDLTEHKKLQEQLTQALKMESVGRLAGGIAHDFNNMLSVILGHAELALMKIDPSQKLFNNLEEIRKSANRSADLTRQLLAFARKQTIVPQMLDLNETVTGMLKMLQRLIGENIGLSWQPEADLWPVMVDPTQIDQILANLCVNARDAIADVGKVIIATGNRTLNYDYCKSHTGAAPGEYVMISIRDNGSGMDRETQAHIFEPFYTTKELGKGTGLGLSTVYGIVKQNNGFIEVYSDPDQGTTFKIFLPRYVGKAVQVRLNSEEMPELHGNEIILLVEDEPAILEVITELLENEGYTVVASSIPSEAISLAREHPGEIHLLITDVIMPEMNGRDLARNLLTLYPHLKRLFMSGYTAEIIGHHGVLEEGVNFIQKPFSMQNLAVKVRDVLDG